MNWYTELGSFHLCPWAINKITIWPNNATTGNSSFLTWEKHNWGSSHVVWARRFLPPTCSTRLAFWGCCGFGTWNTRPLTTVSCALPHPLPLGQQGSLLLPRFWGWVPHKEGFCLPWLLSLFLGHWSPGLHIWLRQSASHLVRTFSARIPGCFFIHLGHRMMMMQRRATADSDSHVARVRKHPLWDKALSLWSGSSDSKTLDYQTTNSREYQIVRTHIKDTSWYKT